MTFEQILSDLKKKIYHPVYFLCGEEPYYIDLLSDFIEKNVLTESEKEFNQTIVYGKDVDVPTLISYARRYPMMSNYQVIILKEAQDLKALFKKTDDKKEEKDYFVEYLQKPTTTTILVVCYKYNSLDKRTKAAKTLAKNAIVYENKRLYDNQIPGWISNYLKEKDVKAGTKAVQLLAEYLGNDLSKIANEIDKLCLNLEKGGEIKPGMVADNIGVSKDFNIFELQNAIGMRNSFKAYQIAAYFAANPKNNPMVLTMTQLYLFFMKVLTYHCLEDRSNSNYAASELGVSPYFLSDYIRAAKEYPPALCIKNIKHLREYDLRSKGVNIARPEDGEILRELIYKLIN